MKNEIWVESYRKCVEIKEDIDFLVFLRHISIVWRDRHCEKVELMSVYKKEQQGQSFSLHVTINCDDIVNVENIKLLFLLVHTEHS